MDDLVTIIGNVGFPIAVAAYLLIRIEGRLQDLSSAILELREAIITLPRDSLISRTVSATVSSNSELSSSAVQ